MARPINTSSVVRTSTIVSCLIPMGQYLCARSSFYALANYVADMSDIRHLTKPTANHHAAAVPATPPRRLPMLPWRLLSSHTLGLMGKPRPGQLVFLTCPGLRHLEEPTLRLHRRRRNLLPLLPHCRPDRPDHPDLSYHFSPQHRQFVELSIQLQHRQFVERPIQQQHRHQYATTIY